MEPGITTCTFRHFDTASASTWLPIFRGALHLGNVCRVLRIASNTFGHVKDSTITASCRTKDVAGRVFLQPQTHLPFIPQETTRPYRRRDCCVGGARNLSAAACPGSSNLNQFAAQTETELPYHWTTSTPPFFLRQLSHIAARFERTNSDL